MSPLAQWDEPVGKNGCLLLNTICHPASLLEQVGDALLPPTKKAWLISNNYNALNRNKQIERSIMAKQVKAKDSVYRVTEVIGTSKTSWEDAAKNAVETASATLRDLRVAEVVKTDVTIENGKVTGYRTRLQLSFKYES